MTGPGPEFRQGFRVGWGDVDGNAHMAGSAILHRAADTRLLFFAERGFPGKRFAEERVGPVMTRDELVYRKELRLLEAFTVDLLADGISADGVRFRIVNTLRNSSEDVTAVVTSEGVWFDLEHRKPRVPPPELDKIARAMPRTASFSEIPGRSR